MYDTTYDIDLKYDLLTDLKIISTDELKTLKGKLPFIQAAIEKGGLCMTLKEPERHVLIAHNRKKSQEAIEQVAWLIDNRQWHLAMNRIILWHLLHAIRCSNSRTLRNHKTPAIDRLV